MGEQRNLTKENVDELEMVLNRMQKTNPDLQYNFYEQEPKRVTLDQIYEKLLDLERKLGFIFGDYALVDGKWTRVAG